MATITEYIVTDRTTATKYSIQVDNTELFYQSTADAASAEPLFDDDVNPGTYWKLFIDDGEMAIESTGTVQDDDLQFEDSTTNRIYKLVVDDGQIGLEDFGPIPGTVTTFTIDPDYTYSEEIGQTTRIVEMESGKEKRMKNGTAKRVFGLQYDKTTETKKDSIISFFNDISGSLQSFNWTNPLDSVQYRCRLSEDGYSINEVAHEQYNIELGFEQDI